MRLRLCWRRPGSWRGRRPVFDPNEPTREAQAAISDIPESCMCTWTWGPPAWRWVRIGAKEDCPWHTAEVRQP